MKTYSNPDPRLHIGMLRQQLSFLAVLYERARRAWDIAMLNELGDEILTLKRLIKAKEA